MRFTFSKAFQVARNFFNIREDWSRWYSSKHLQSAPEKCFENLKPLIPDYVDSVLDFGCAAGRNLTPFNNEFKLYGVDLPEKDNIRFSPLNHFTYFQGKLQEFKAPFSLSKFLCISHGTLMYLTADEQGHFIEHLIESGCKNFIFQEYDLQTLKDGGYDEFSIRYVAYPFVNKFKFKKVWFKGKNRMREIPCWIKLDADIRNEVLDKFGAEVD